jgi:hypothetical protein
MDEDKSQLATDHLSQLQMKSSYGPLSISLKECIFQRCKHYNSLYEGIPLHLTYA